MVSLTVELSFLQIKSSCPKKAAAGTLHPWAACLRILLCLLQVKGEAPSLLSKDRHRAHEVPEIFSIRYILLASFLL